MFGQDERKLTFFCIKKAFQLISPLPCLIFDALTYKLSLYQIQIWEAFVLCFERLVTHGSKLINY